MIKKTENLLAAVEILQHRVKFLEWELKAYQSLLEDKVYLEDRLKWAENMIENLRKDKKDYGKKIAKLREFIRDNFGEFI